MVAQGAYDPSTPVMARVVSVAATLPPSSVILDPMYKSLLGYETRS
ncbi:MAG: hypothetical protein MUO67_13625 [Anaerolineales bacterium]|nr:hypothetical protein [Anaerolineales bacterium]